MSEWEFDTLDPKMVYVPFDGKRVKVTLKGLFYEVGTVEEAQAAISKIEAVEYEDSPREELP